MKKFIVTIVIATSLIGMIRLGVIDFLFSFLLIGIIPGTDYSITPQAMLIITTVGMLLVAFYLIPFSFLPQATQKKKKPTVSKKKKTGKQNSPRRRYGEI